MSRQPLLKSYPSMSSQASSQSLDFHSHASQEISIALATALANPSTVLSTAESHALRKNYETLFTTTPVVQVYKDLGTIAQILRDTHASALPAVAAWNVQKDKFVTRVESLGNANTATHDKCVSAITIGRTDMTRDTHIVVPDQDRTVSRFTAVIFPVPHEYVLVVDIGSMHGITTIVREDHNLNSPTEDSSTPDKRRILKFPWGEMVTLKIGQHTQMTLWPAQTDEEVCAVCKLRPRRLRMRCGHQVSCMECIDRIAECDICGKRGRARSVEEEMARSGGVVQSEAAQQAFARQLSDSVLHIDSSSTTLTSLSSGVLTPTSPTALTREDSRRSSRSGSRTPLPPIPESFGTDLE